MFDPITSQILAELENGEKDSSYLASIASVSESEVHDRLEYLILHEFVKEKRISDKLFYEADGIMLSKIIENDENFSSTIDGLTKMDSYLN